MNFGATRSLLGWEVVTKAGTRVAVTDLARARGQPLQHRTRDHELPLSHAPMIFTERLILRRARADDLGISTGRSPIPRDALLGHALACVGRTDAPVARR